MKVIAKETTVWIEDPKLEELGEMELFSLCERIQTDLIICKQNKFKQLIITYDPTNYTLYQIKSFIRLALR